MPDLVAKPKLSIACQSSELRLWALHIHTDTRSFQSNLSKDTMPRKTTT